MNTVVLTPSNDFLGEGKQEGFFAFDRVPFFVKIAIAYLKHRKIQNLGIDDRMAC